MMSFRLTAQSRRLRTRFLPACRVNCGVGVLTSKLPPKVGTVGQAQLRQLQTEAAWLLWIKLPRR